MQINIYKDQFEKAYLFDAPVLYSGQPIPREDVPQGWFCYDLRGMDRAPDRPYSMANRIVLAKNYLLYSVFAGIRYREKRNVENGTIPNSV